MRLPAYLLVLIICPLIFAGPLYAGLESVVSDEVVVLYEGDKRGIAEGEKYCSLLGSS